MSSAGDELARARGTGGKDHKTWDSTLSWIQGHGREHQSQGALDVKLRDDASAGGGLHLCCLMAPGTQPLWFDLFSLRMFW